MQKKTTVISVRISAEEHEQIRRAKGGRSLSDFVRELVVSTTGKAGPGRQEDPVILMRNLTVMFDEFVRQESLREYEIWKRAVRDRIEAKEGGQLNEKGKG